MLVGDVVREHHSVCLVDIGLDHFAEYTLAANVPDLQRYVYVSIKLASFYKKINAYGLFVAFCEVVLTATHDKTGFAYGAVAKDYYFELKVFGLIIAILLLFNFGRFCWLFLFSHIKQ